MDQVDQMREFGFPPIDHLTRNAGHCAARNFGQGGGAEHPRDGSSIKAWEWLRAEQAHKLAMPAQGLQVSTSQGFMHTMPSGGQFCRVLGRDALRQFIHGGEGCGLNGQHGVTR